MYQHSKKLLTLGALLISTSASAYQYEVGGNIGRADSDDDDETIFSFEGTIYMSDINRQQGPRREDPFLAKASYVTFAFDDDGSEQENTVVSGRYLFDTTNNHFLEGEHTAGTVDFLNINLGTYLTDMSTASGGITRLSTASDDEFLINGNYKQLFGLNSSSTLLGEASLTLGDIRIIELTGGIYLDRNIGVALTFTDVDSDDYQDSQSFAVEGSFFLQPNIELYASYENSEVDTGVREVDNDTILVGANVRFD